MLNLGLGKSEISSSKKVSELIIEAKLMKVFIFLNFIIFVFKKLLSSKLLLLLRNKFASALTEGLRGLTLKFVLNLALALVFSSLKQPKEVFLFIFLVSETLF